jgi:hypothetical protein
MPIVSMDRDRRADTHRFGAAFLEAADLKRATRDLNQAQDFHSNA